MARNGNAKTKHVALNMLKVSVAISGAALLFACGDDDSSFVASENGGSAAEADIVVATFDYLPNCTDNREGKTAYIKDEKTAYVCVDGDWIIGSISESVDDLLNCTSKHEGETVFVKEDKEIYVCTDADWVVAGETGDEGDDDGDDAGQKSSSSKAKSADSKDKSSSSVESSSGVIPGSDPESSSSDELSSSSRGLFEMSKDEFLNPKISYGEMTDERDGQKYKTVKIGDQMWMAENLNYDYNKGTAKSYCFVDNEVNCAVTGRLYTWAAAIDSVALANDADNPQTCGYGKTCTLPTVVQGVCPEGWHLPSYDEWRNLIEAAGGIFYAGQKLKADSDLWNKGTSNDDSFGFAVLPAGYRSGNGSFYGEGSYAYFWSSTEYYSYGAYERYFDFRSDAVYNDWYDKSNRFFSVRCLRDSN